MQVTIEEDFLTTPDKESEILATNEIDSPHTKQNTIKKFEHTIDPIPQEPLSEQNPSSKISSNNSSSKKSSSDKSLSKSSKSKESNEKKEPSIQSSDEDSNEDLFDNEFVDSSSSVEETSADIQIPVTDLKEVTPNSASQELLLNLKEKESGLPESRNTTCCGSCRMF